MIIDTNNRNNKKHLEEKEDIHNVDTPKAIILLVLCIVLIIVIVIYKVYTNHQSNYNYLKEDKSEYIVYTRYNQNKKEVPYINVDSNEIRNLNNQIVEYCNQYVNIEDLSIIYNYNISGNYLSVVIQVQNNETEVPEITFKTYNINLKRRVALSDDEIKNYFKVSDDLIYAKIHNRLLEMYNEEVKEGYFVEEICDYDCYLKNRNIENYLDDINFYIKDGKLIVFKPFNFKSIFKEEDYFTAESFEFQISE